MPSLQRTTIVTALLVVGGAADIGRLQAQQPLKDSIQVNARTLQKIDSVFTQWTGSASPGCVVAADQNGRRLFIRSYGMANLEHGVPIAPQSVFEAGSVSKQFTAAAVLLLAADGHLHLTDNVRKYIPELPDYGDVITIDHLLTHSSGLADWGTIMFYAGWPRGERVYTNAAAVEIIARHATLTFKPGTFFSYTNSGYTLLTEIVRRVSGKSLEAFTEERIFRPFGMQSTRWRTDYRAIVPGRTTAYRKLSDGFVQDMPFENTYGHAGLLTTVEDLLIWNRVLDEKRLGVDVTSLLETAGRQQDGRALPYARGLWANSYRSFKELSHGGATAGYRAWLGRYPETGLSVALLCNGPANDVGLGRAVAAEFLPARPIVTTTSDSTRGATAQISVEQARAFAGHFEREKLGTPFTVTADGARLSISGEPAVALGGNRFKISWGEFRFDSNDVLHELDSDGKIFQTFRRISGALPTASDLQQYEGRYRSAAALATYSVTISSGQLLLTVDGRPDYVFKFNPIGPDTFRSTGAVLKARRDASGRVTELTLSTDRLRDLRLVRV